ncbi:MAG: hypothetical protein KKC84_04765 [Candidatus Omnitrophica bacterium]|nr:hypothetical protein [Candidatus Omnitrophota bacterium]
MARRFVNKFIRSSGFATLEYAILIFVAVAAMVAMTAYIRRSLNAKYRESADTFGYGRQYEPGVTRGQ